VIEPFGYAAARRVARPMPARELADALAGAVPPLVIDVDQSDVYTRGHVPGAAWICRSRLEQRIDDVALDKTRGIVTTCGDGRASTLAAATLVGQGYSARVLDGGSAAWQAEGRTIERGTTRLADEVDDVIQSPHDRGRSAMEAYLRWEEALDDEGWSPHALLEPRP
jgi:rhodanese-related sulfurtransferase